jgi:Sterol desaturase
LQYVGFLRPRLGITGIVASGLAVFLGGTNVQIDAIGETPYSLGLVRFGPADFGDRLHPAEKTLFQGCRAEHPAPALAYLPDVLLVQFILIFITALLSYMAGWAVSTDLQANVQSLPIVVQFLLAVLVADLGQYWLHRLYHMVPWLWRIHAVHHSSTSMGWLTGSRIHFVEILLTRTGVLLRR